MAGHQVLIAAGAVLSVAARVVACAKAMPLEFISSSTARMAK